MTALPATSFVSWLKNPTSWPAMRLDFPALGHDVEESWPSATESMELEVPDSTGATRPMAGMLRTPGPDRGVQVPDLEETAVPFAKSFFVI